jgi:hypothetical protein
VEKGKREEEREERKGVGKERTNSGRRKGDERKEEREKFGSIGKEMMKKEE